MSRYSAKERADRYQLELHRQVRLKPLIWRVLVRAGTQERPCFMWKVMSRGSSWERLGEDAQEELSASLEGWSPNLPLLFPVTARQEEPSITLTIRYADRPSWIVYFPYQPTHTAGAVLEGDSVLLSPEARQTYKWKRPVFHLIFPHIRANDFEAHEHLS